MSGLIDTYGYELQSLLTSAEEVWQRLRRIPSDKVLRFNPYPLDDATLLACVERARWRPFLALTQMTVFLYGKPSRPSVASPLFPAGNKCPKGMFQSFQTSLHDAVYGAMSFDTYCDIYYDIYYDIHNDITMTFTVTFTMTLL